MPKKLSKQEFIERLSIESPRITLIGDIGDFVATKIKTLFRCACGNSWEAKPNEIRFRMGCPSCVVKHKSKTSDDMVEWLKQDGRNYSLVGSM